MTRRHLVLAQAIAERLPGILEARGLEPAFRRFLVTTEGRAWLFAELDLERVGRMERYLHPEVLHQIRAALGRAVYVSNTHGLRYAFPLDRISPLPEKAPFPGVEPGWIRLGIALDGEARIRLEELGHGLVAGISGSGKSNFLRLVAFQAAAQGARVLALDPHGDLEGIAHQAWEIPEAMGWLEAVEGIIETRRTGREREPMVLAIADELTAAIVHHGGSRSAFARRLAAAIWQARKFGIRFVVALHEASREAVGMARDAIAWRVAFRLPSASASRMILGHPGAERLRIKGRALTEPWGVVQTYMAPETEAPISDEKLALLREALEGNQGLVTLGWLMSRGIPERQARRLLRAWRAAGWIEKDPARANAHRATARAERIVQTSEPSEPVRAVQTASKPIQTR